MSFSPSLVALSSISPLGEYTEKTPSGSRNFYSTLVVKLALGCRGTVAKQSGCLQLEEKNLRSAFYTASLSFSISSRDHHAIKLFFTATAAEMKALVCILEREPQPGCGLIHSSVNQVSSNLFIPITPHYQWQMYTVMEIPTVIATYNSRFILCPIWI